MRLRAFGGVTAAALLLSACTGLIFQPLKRHLYAPAELGIEAHDVWFAGDGGLRLHGWFLPAEGAWSARRTA